MLKKLSILAFLVFSILNPDPLRAEEGLIPFDIPDEDQEFEDGIPLDLLGLCQMFDGINAQPPPPIETAVIGTFDAATGGFTWGPDVQMRTDLSQFIRIGPVFNERNIRAVQFDPTDMSLLDIGLETDLTNAINSAAVRAREISGVPAAGAAPRFRPPAGSTPKKGTSNKASDPKSAPGAGAAGGAAGGGGAGGASGNSGGSGGTLSGHSTSTRTFWLPVKAGKVSMVFQVTNAPQGAELKVKAHNRTRSAQADAVDVIVPPRAWVDFEVSCAGKSFADRLHFDRPPAIGCFMLEALPVTIIYEPPGSGSSQTYTSETTIGTELRTFTSSEDNSTTPVNTPYSSVDEFIEVIGAVGGAVKAANPAVGEGMEKAAKVLGAAWGSSDTDEKFSHSITDEHTLKIELRNSQSFQTTSHTGPGQGDGIHFLVNPVFAWLAAQDDETGEVFVTISLLGCRTSTSDAAFALRDGHPMLSDDMCKLLLAQDPLAPEYVSASKKRKGANVPGLLGGSMNSSGSTSASSGGNPAKGRFIPAYPHEQVVPTGMLETYEFERTIEESDENIKTSTHTLTTTEEGGFLSFVSSKVPQSGTTEIVTTQGVANKRTETNKVKIEVELSAGNEQEILCRAYYDAVYGTFAFVPVPPGEGMVSGAMTSADGEPAAGQDVIIELANGLAIRTRTDAQGKYQFRSSLLEPGEHRIIAGKQKTPLKYEGKPIRDLQLKSSKGVEDARANRSGGSSVGDAIGDALKNGADIGTAPTNQKQIDEALAQIVARIEQVQAQIEIIEQRIRDAEANQARTRDSKE